MKKICVTGAYGFIGKSICEFLADSNISVTGFVRDLNLSKNSNNIDYIPVGDIGLKINLKSNLIGTDCIIHCAGRAHVMNETKADSLKIYHSANVDGTKQLAEQAVEAGVKRFIFLSSIGVNGISTKISEKFTSKDTPAPIENYAISKLRAEEALLHVSKKTGLEVVIIRLPLVYGERVKGNFLRLLNIINKGFLLPFGKIDNLKSFIGLDNLIDLIIYCIDHPSATGKIFLASDGEDISTTDLIKKLSNAMGKPKRLFPFPVPVIKLIGKIFKKSYEAERLLSSLRIDSSDTQKLLGWKPPFTLDEGLLNTVKWYLNKK